MEAKSRRGLVSSAARTALALLVGSTAGTALVAQVLGAGRPGYDPVETSLSRLGQADSPDAWLFNLAVAVTGLVIVLAGAVVAGAGLRRPGLAVALAGTLLVAAALVPLDGNSAQITWFHRSLTAAALAGLVAGGSAALMSRVAWCVGMVGLSLNAGLLLPHFPGGLWERCLFAFALSEVALVLVRLAQAPPDMSAASAPS